MKFDQVLEQLNSGELSNIPNNWSQGRTTFGGLSAALIYLKILEQVDGDKTLRNFDLSFCGPLYIDHSFNISVELLRSGRTISSYSARIEQDDRICVSAQATFATAIDSTLSINTVPALNLPHVEKAKLLDTSSTLFPEFVKNLELHFTSGDPMFSGSELPGYEGWMKFKHDSAEMQVAHLIALIDAWPPATSSCLSKPSALSTVNWNIKLAQPLPDITPLLAYQSTTDYSENGMAFTRANVSNTDGNLLALSEQSTIAYE